MTPDDIRAAVLRLLTNVAPEVDPADLRSDVSLRDQLDVDSMDLLNFVISLHKEFGIEIPERDYARLMTVDGCVAYIAEACRGRSA
jgi:acyl carrier protein